MRPTQPITPRHRRLPAVVGLCLSLTGLAFCGNLASANHAAPKPKDPGIHVGKIKLYDERTLRLMLEGAEANLAALKLFHQDTLTGALGRIQGRTLETRSQAFKVSPVPTPEVVDVLTQTPPAPKEGVKQPPLVPSQRETTVTQAPRSAEIPALPEGTAAFTPPAVGIAAQDLLAEMEALQFQVINLRMLLQGAITDKLMREKLGNQTNEAPRAKVVVSFPVTIEAGKDHKDSLVEVDVTIQPQGAGTPGAPQTSDQGINIVTLFPREKTYNVAEVRRDTRSLGLGAVFQLISFGFNSSRGRESEYLVKDVDTVALHRPAGVDRAARFAWQFRPVLDRRVIEPGVRHVFAVLSVPAYMDGRDYPVEVKVNTRWRKYNRRARTMGDLRDGWPAAPEATYPYTLLHAKSTDDLLRPHITNLAWQDNADGTLLVTVDGYNFTPEVAVRVDQETILKGENLIVQSDNRLVFNLPSEPVTRGTVSLQGAYGTLQPLLSGSGLNLEAGSQQVKVAQVTATPAAGNTYLLSIDVQVTDVRSAPALQEQAVVLVGEQVHGLRQRPIRRKAHANGFTLELEVPAALLRQVSDLTVAVPFAGSKARDTHSLADALKDDFSATEVSLISSTALQSILAIRGAGFSPYVRVLIGEQQYKPRYRNPGLLELGLKPEQLLGVEQLVLTKPRALTVLLPIKQAIELADPVITEFPELKVGDSKEVTMKGAFLTSILDIEFEGHALKPYAAAEDGKTLKFRVTNAVTATATSGKSRQLDLILKNGKRIPFLIEVKPS